MVTRALSVILAVALGASVAHAQTRVDGLTPPLPTQAERTAADIASWATVIAAVSFDAHASLKCDGQDDCYRAVTRTAMRLGSLSAPRCSSST
jgi:hypothetical protein